MHRFAVVPQSLLREPFGITHGLGAFGPSVSVTMERDACDPELTAMLPKLRRPIAGAHAGQIRSNAIPVKYSV